MSSGRSQSSWKCFFQPQKTCWVRRTTVSGNWTSGASWRPPGKQGCPTEMQNSSSFLRLTVPRCVQLTSCRHLCRGHWNYWPAKHLGLCAAHCMEHRANDKINNTMSLLNSFLFDEMTIKYDNGAFNYCCSCLLLALWRAVFKWPRWKIRLYWAKRRCPQFKKPCHLALMFTQSITLCWFCSVGWTQRILNFCLNSESLMSCLANLVFYLKFSWSQIKFF